MKRTRAKKRTNIRHLHDQLQSFKNDDWIKMGEKLKEEKKYLVSCIKSINLKFDEILNL